MLLLEHQSSVERLMAFRMLRYVLRILDRWLQQNPGGQWLPVVLPMVLYHGPEGGWTAPLKVEELFGLPPEFLELLAPLLPRFECRVDDMPATREEALRARDESYPLRLENRACLLVTRARPVSLSTLAF